MNQFSVATILVIVVVAIEILTRYQPAQATPKGNAPEEVVAKRILIVDKSGRPRIELTVDEEGPVIAIKDESSKAGVRLVLSLG